MADAALEARLAGLDTLVRQLQGAAGQRRRGVVNVASVASVTSNTATVTHGLGSTPSLVLANAQNASAGLVNVDPFNIGPTTFDLQFRYTDGVARSLTIVVGWEAIV